jgi:hypothetical protein
LGINLVGNGCAGTRGVPPGLGIFNFLSSKSAIFIYYKGKYFTFPEEYTIIKVKITQEVVRARHGEKTNHHRCAEKSRGAVSV